MSAPAEAYAYCLDALKAASRDHYLACLLMPEAIREQMAALFLFDIETARIRDLVHEPLPGEIRLQWWRDLLESEGDGAESGPLARALKDVIARNSLPAKPFIDLLDARIFDLYDDPMGSVEDFELYAGETASTPIQLGLMICSPAKAQSLVEAAGHAGVAVAAARVIRNLVAARGRGQVYIPKPMLQAAGLDRESFLSAKAKEKKLAAAVELFAGFGTEHLEKARKTFDGGKDALWPFLPASLTQQTFKLAKKQGAAVFNGAPTEKGPLARQWRLWRAASSGRF